MKKKLNKSNNSGKFGSYGGQFVPETLMLALEELSSYYEAIKNDPVFIQEFSDYLKLLEAGRLLYILQKI